MAGLFVEMIWLLSGVATLVGTPSVLLLSPVTVIAEVVVGAIGLTCTRTGSTGLTVDAKRSACILCGAVVVAGSGRGVIHVGFIEIGVPEGTSCKPAWIRFMWTTFIFL